MLVLALCFCLHAVKLGPELLLQDIESKLHFNKEVDSKEYLELVLRVGMQCYNLQKLQSQEFSASVRQDIVFYVENALKPLCSEKELLQKTPPIKLIHFPNNLEKWVFLQKVRF